MVPIRYFRKRAWKIVHDVIRCDVSFSTAAFVIVVMFFLVNSTVNMYKSPTVMTNLDNMKIDIGELQKDTSNTILIEQNDGEIYVAFRLRDTAKIVKDVRGGKILLRRTKNAENLQSKEEADLRNETKNESTEIVQPTFPVTLLDDMYNINNRLVCSSSKELSFLVVVHSATVHFMRRSSIRETWANHRLFSNHSMRIIFLLGMPEKDTTQTLIEHETMLYKDIVQGKFVDSYKNLTHKGVLGLRWITENCKQARFIIKVDDDVFLNVFKVLEKVETEFKNKTRNIWCPVRKKGTSEIQRKSGKWKVDEREFKNMTHFPVTYCNGFISIITSDIIPELFEAARTTPFFWVDDVYLFGLLPDKIGGVKHEGLPHLNLNENDAIKCFENTNKTCPLLVANAHSDGVMDKLWYRAIDQYKTLAKKYSHTFLFNV
ncbi:lactosylceramide 1,3-N-acetyl-beta-D-glucosaminyltransferase-like isoform X1 [Mya arenaria]|uniref:lactosylceramide 1,3-N-acetyl-beta-D-glucosaminyltransferase-like isoform X1 n=1 Tax=Mya arenaria TaxID=6604 RepID=UPI0022E52B53|nr:lactosylceramide 1,3-N-acetyl-beta-D-glucosaminyltransferase-like isoform X1 [Mya arenaria]XP_052795956.1 lactosylceramide 1,3-N-acetyl-beta-D-glucosaminyltransferase-like isoform X1 [Mya arenaria]